jgi:hypothetical protein
MEFLEADKVVNWVKITDKDKKALAESKKKKKLKDKKEEAAKKRMTEKLAKVDATVAAEKKKMDKAVEQAKRKAMNKEKVASVKRVGAKKGKGKPVGGGNKAPRKTPKAVGSSIPKAGRAKAAPGPKSKKGLVGGVPPVKELAPGSTAAKGGSKHVEEKHPGACHHGTLLDLKAMNGAVLASYLRPGEYMNGMDCEECSKSCKDLRERDQFGTMLYYCDKSVIAWQLPDGDDGKDGEIYNLVLCPGCFVVRSGRVGGRRQHAWRGY